MGKDVEKICDVFMQPGRVHEKGLHSHVKDVVAPVDRIVAGYFPC